MTSLTSLLSPCPFCGRSPHVDTEGTYIQFVCHWCTVLMTLQKSDYLSQDQQRTWGNRTHSFSRDAERQALSGAVAKWNHRED